MSPTQRSLKRLRDAGWLAEVVERWIPRINIRKDLFGCIDLLAIREGQPPLAIQTTTMSNRGSRIKKAGSLTAIQVWLATGSRFEVWAWRKLGNKYALARTEFYVQDGRIAYGEVNEA